ncbi:MAG: hypothetical protein QXW52_08685 [Candidatus Caldarchaeum sp.]
MSDEREWEEYEKKREEEWQRMVEEYEREREESEREWEEYERLWSRVIRLTRKFHESIASGDKDPQELDQFIDDMIRELREAGYARPSDD